MLKGSCFIPKNVKIIKSITIKTFLCQNTKLVLFMKVLFSSSNSVQPPVLLPSWKAKHDQECYKHEPKESDPGKKAQSCRKKGNAIKNEQTNLMKVLRSIVASGSIAVGFLPCVNFLHCDMSFVSVTSHWFMYSKRLL